MPILYTIVFKLLVPIFSFIVGIFLILKPNEAIRIQQKFYAMINWRMEPICQALELRNTRIMGVVLILLGILAWCIK